MMFDETSMTRLMVNEGLISDGSIMFGFETAQGFGVHLEQSS